MPPKESTRAKKLAAAHLLLVNGAKQNYADALTGAGYRVTTVDTMRDALASRSRADAVIVELIIPEGDLAGIRRVTMNRRRTRAMMVIALAEDTHQTAVVNAGATFCRQPCPPDELVRFVDKTLALRTTLKDGEGQRSNRRV